MKPHIKRILVDWDGTLVQDKTLTFLPGAIHFLQEVKASNVKLCIFTSTHTSPYDIRDLMLSTLGPSFKYELLKHPPAEVLIDNRALKFNGDWFDIAASLCDDRCEPWDKGIR